jgi:hypothetical protein
LASKYPDIVEKLKKKLAEVIKDGRSTEGKKIGNDRIGKGVKWKELKVVEDYL